MLTINLTKVEDSQIKWESSSFPDGQQDIVINKEIHGSRDLCILDHVLIKSRFNNFRDLELIICAVKALRRLEVRSISLYVPYILGARSDRQFQEGGTSYLVDVVAPILNSLNLLSIECLDVHSDVAAACINNLKVKSNDTLIRWALMDVYINNPKPLNECFVLVSPDAGASKKIEKLASSIGYTGDIITCSKSRGIDGKLSRTEVPLTDAYRKKDLIIVDDICDGGQTFINIRDRINFYMPEAKVYLIVTHGIFSQGVDRMKSFEKVYTTNSIRDLGPDNMDPYHAKKHNIKQLDVF